METTPESRRIEIDEKTLKQLKNASRWTMFIAIMGFILLGLIIVIGLIAGTFLSAFNAGNSSLGIPEPLMYVIFIVLAVIFFIPIHFLFRFSKLMETAVTTLDKHIFHKAIKNLKYYFAYIGVLIIIVLAFYIAALIMEGTSIAFLKNQ